LGGGTAVCERGLDAVFPVAAYRIITGAVPFTAGHIHVTAVYDDAVSIASAGKFNQLAVFSVAGSIVGVVV
jgi:hypothetical protein